jgi:2'-5' RNA ligase
MARKRLGVALLVPEPLAHEIDGLRRACGDRALERVPPHLTLVPPVNVAESRLAEALGRLRDGASALGADALSLDLGPVTSFLPDSSTLYLAVGGDAANVEALDRVREVVFRPPLERSLTWPFVPHVTVADELDADRIDAAVVALADYRRRVTFTGVHLLEERRGDGSVRWEPIADYRFGGPYPVGRGGLPLDLFVSDGPDPEAGALLEVASLDGSGLVHDPSPPTPGGWRRLVVTARRRDDLAGVATGWTDGRRSHVGVVVVAPDHRGEGIARHLYARLIAEGGADVVDR